MDAFDAFDSLASNLLHIVGCFLLTFMLKFYRSLQLLQLFTMSSIAAHTAGSVLAPMFSNFKQHGASRLGGFMCHNVQG